MNKKINKWPLMSTYLTTKITLVIDNNTLSMLKFKIMSINKLVLFKNIFK